MRSRVIQLLQKIIEPFPFMHGIELRRYSHEISLILKYIDVKSDINFHVYFNKKIRDYAVPCYILCFHSVSVIGQLEAAHIYKKFF